jgi:O-antigen/teichoic acid export membrane protein
MLIPLALLAIAAGELAITVTFSAQTAAAHTLASIFMITSITTMLGDLSCAVLIGERDFGFPYLTRVMLSLFTLIGYLGLYATGRLTVVTSLLTIAVTGTGATAALAIRVVMRHGLGRPSLSLGRSTLWYGTRAHGTNVVSVMNTRLDSILLPAFVVASSLGLYSVAVSISEIVFVLCSALVVLILPTAARRSRQSQQSVVLGLMYATVVLAAGLALGLELFATIAVRIVYGDAFLGGVPALRVLLIGAVFYSASGALSQGLCAANRPFLASLAQFPGLVVTVVGLLVFLPRGGGIIAAAAISTVAYASVFAASALLYCHVLGLPLRSIVRPWDHMRLTRANSSAE